VEKIGVKKKNLHRITGVREVCTASREGEQLKPSRQVAKGGGGSNLQLIRTTTQRGGRYKAERNISRAPGNKWAQINEEKKQGVGVIQSDREEKNPLHSKRRNTRGRPSHEPNRKAGSSFRDFRIRPS